MSDAGRAFVTDLVLILTAMTLGAGLIGLLAKWFLVPWLKTHIVAPVQETNRQVKVNGHTSEVPTLLDTIHTVRGHVEAVQGEVGEARGAFLLAARMFEGHITASEEDRASLWKAVERLEDTNARALEEMRARLEHHLTTLATLATGKSPS